MAVVKKSVQQRILETKALLVKLEAEASGKVLGKASPGMDQVLAAIDAACESNKCKTVDVIKCISKLKKLGLTIEAPARKPRKKKESNV